MGLQKNLDAIKGELTKQATLIAVSKRRSLEEINELYQAGQRDFGENRVDELLAKATSDLLKDKAIRWHFIGPLQSNKIKQLLTVPHLVAVHSVSKLKTLKALAQTTTPLDIFIQFNTSREDEKNGLTPSEDILFEELHSFIQKSENLRLRGLMTMSGREALHASDCFKELVLLKDNFNEKYSLNLQLSMGMSQDYQTALTLGSHYIRIGTKLFS